jgi:cytochrome c-type biogenesis protein CcmE
MHPLRKQRLYWVSLIVVLSSAAIGLVVFAVNQDKTNSDKQRRCKL